MNEDANNLTCAAFQAQLPELIGSDEDANSHPHLQSCELCRALLTDLETIAEAARQLFPVADPPEALWEHIESAIKNDSKSSESGLSVGNEIGTSNTDLSAEPA
jgi:predicted anti-sigma-YlaC factor YlaD